MEIKIEIVLLILGVSGFIFGMLIEKSLGVEGILILIFSFVLIVISVIIKNPIGNIFKEKIQIG
jgi:hypothetical protein